MHQRIRPAVVPISPVFRPDCILFWLKLFGSASIDGPDGPVTGRAVQRRRLGLLGLLATARSGVTRDRLTGYLWPDSSTDRARHLLSDSVYRINRAVGGEAVIAVGDELRLNPERLPCDVWEFAEAIDRQDWLKAVELHVAPFMDGFFLKDGDELERWIDGQRERLARDHARALEAVAEAAESREAHTDAARWWRVLAGLDPYSSRIALRLMRVLDRAGDRAAALQHAHAHTLLLDEEMGLAPDSDLLEFVAELRSRPAPLPKPLRAQPRDPSRDESTRAAARAHESLLPSAAAPAAPRHRKRLAAVAAAAALVITAGLIIALERGDAEAGVPAIAALQSDPVGANVDADAFNLYLRGRHQWHRRNEPSLRAAADYFRQAVERAPQYARAHAGLGDAYAVLGFYDFLPPREAFPAAAHAARRALELDPSLGEAHATLGYVALYYEWDWLRAEREFRRAIELEPAYSTGHQWYANFLTAMGRFDEAAARMEAAMELDPLSVIANAALGWVLYLAGDYDRAIDQCTRALEIDPDFALAWRWRAMAHEEPRSFDAALHDFDHAVRLSGGSTLHAALRARGLALAGRRDEARALLEELQSRHGTDYLPPYELAKVQSALGETDAALQSLERAYEHRSHSIAFLAVDPQLAPLRSHPRFQQLLRRAGLGRTQHARGR